MRSKVYALAGSLLTVVMLTAAAGRADIAIPRETHTGHLTSGIYGWNYSYDAELTTTNLNLYMTIRLEPQAGVTAEQLANCMTTWKSGIQSLYSDKFSLTVNGGQKRPIEFNLSFTTTGTDYDHDALVYSSLTRGDMNDWDSRWIPTTAAHEVGHMWGLFDEYSGGATDPNGAFIDSGNVMGTGALSNGVARQRHYDTLLAWLNQEQPGNSFAVAQGVPEPMTLTVLLAGGWLVLKRRRMRVA